MDKHNTHKQKLLSKYRRFLKESKRRAREHGILHNKASRAKHENLALFHLVNEGLEQYAALIFEQVLKDLEEL